VISDDDLAHIPAKACPGVDPKWTPVRRQEYAPNEESPRKSDSIGFALAMRARHD
jgi:hypothetical protein